MRGARSGGGGGPACFFLKFLKFKFSGEFSSNGEFVFQQGKNFVGFFWRVF
jgi:hypothetical protein